MKRPNREKGYFGKKKLISRQCNFKISDTFACSTPIPVIVSFLESYLKFSIPVQRDKILLVQRIRTRIERGSSYRKLKKTVSESPNSLHKTKQIPPPWKA